MEQFGLRPTYANGIANRVDPDQTAPFGAVSSESALLAQTYLSKYSKTSMAGTLMARLLRLFRTAS